MKRGGRVGRSLAAVVCMFVAGCADQASEPLTHPLVGVFSVAASASVRTVRDEFRDLAQRAPGFAGVFYDSTGQLTISVASDRFRSEDVDEVLRWVRGYSATYREGMVPRIRRVEFTYDRLDSVYRVLGVRLRGAAFITGGGIDETRGKVLFTVADPGGRDSILRVASALGVPTRMLRVEEVPHLDAQCYEDCGGGGSGGGGGGGGGTGALTLRDYVRPTAGGLELGFNAVGSPCTLGFNGFRYPDPSAGWVFMTAAHCSINRGTVSGTLFGQPDLGRQIGVEIWQAEIYTAPHVYCPPMATRCTFADALVGLYDDTVASNYGVVEKTNIASLTITGLTGVTGGLVGALTGEQVWMVGRTSGTRQGTVLNSCIDRNTSADLGLFVICAAEANYCADGGDSGAPVFMPFDPGAPEGQTPRPVGLHFTSFDGCGPDYYSNMGQILNAQGYYFHWW